MSQRLPCAWQVRGCDVWFDGGQGLTDHLGALNGHCISVQLQPTAAGHSSSCAAAAEQGGPDSMWTQVAAQALAIQGMRINDCSDTKNNEVERSKTQQVS